MMSLICIFLLDCGNFFLPEKEANNATAQQCQLSDNIIPAEIYSESVDS
jgi:hypothetical protein